MTSSILTFTLESFQQKGDRKGQKVFEEILSENFPNLGKETDIQVQEAQSSKQDEPKDIAGYLPCV